MIMEADIAVIGSGPAGLTAAIHAHRSGARKVLLLEREEELGGILKQCIHNGFGLEQFKQDYTGPEYAERLIKELEETDVQCFLNTLVTDLSSDRVITALSPEHGALEIKAKSIILAMGCRERTRSSIGVPGTRPAGIFTAGVAQRFVNIDGYLPGKEIVILGSGDIGLIMARRLTLEGASVIGVYEIMNYPGGLKRNIVQCLNDFNIPLYLSHTVTEIRGKERIEGVIISKVDSDLNPVEGSEQSIKCDTLLLSVGLMPENELSKKAGIELSASTGGPVTTEILETSVPGIFTCGNVSTVFDLVDYVAQTGTAAGTYAARYAFGQVSRRRQPVDVVAGENVRLLFPQRYSFQDDLVLFIRAADPVEKPVTIEVAPLGSRINRPYARPNEMLRLKIPKGKLAEAKQPIKVNIREK
jgi:NADPH-dependent 2,4-dienoyl-CoA reductase/sulfur reductase-like enzyme